MRWENIKRCWIIPICEGRDRIDSPVRIDSEFSFREPLGNVVLLKRSPACVILGRRTGRQRGRAKAPSDESGCSDEDHEHDLQLVNHTVCVSHEKCQKTKLKRSPQILGFYWTLKQKINFNWSVSSPRLVGYCIRCDAIGQVLTLMRCNWLTTASHVGWRYMHSSKKKRSCHHETF